MIQAQQMPDLMPQPALQIDAPGGWCRITRKLNVGIEQNIGFEDLSRKQNCAAQRVGSRRRV